MVPGQGLLRQHVVHQPRGDGRLHETVDKPWIAFKVLAAGAILPRQGFLTPSTTGPTSSPWACSISRSRPIATWRNALSALVTTASGPGERRVWGYLKRDAPVCRLSLREKLWLSRSERQQLLIGRP